MSKTTKKLLIAAVAAIPLGLASSAPAQYQVGSDGRALDASNQIGSGGYNQSVGRRTAVTPDDIVYGNVTAGRHFRGSVSTFDAREFRGSTTGITSDRFIRDSAGVPLPGTARVDLTRPQTFYGQGRGVVPPPNTAQVGATGAFVDASDALRIDSSIAGRQPGSINYARPGALILPSGAQAPIDHQSVLSGSPLYGVREFSLDDPYLTGLSDTTTQGLTTPEQRQLQSMQQELMNLWAAPTQPGDATEQPQPGQGLNDALQRPFESPENTALGQQQAQQQQNLLQGSALTGDLATGGSRANRLLLPTPAQQSTQYAELQRRLQRYQQQTQTESDIAAREFREQQRQLAQAQGAERQPQRPGMQPVQPGQGVQPGQPRRDTGAVRQPADVTPPPGHAVLPPAVPQREIVIPEDLPKPGQPPLQVKSLAEGIQAQGLKNVMQEAEDALQRGRYRDALIRYEAAEQVAPNNPLIQLGKVNALLGSTSFARAYPTLRNAFAQDPALLLAQYDLKAMFGQENIEKIVKELKFVADVEKNSPEAMFLLAYVAYNSGSEEMAAQYLAEANRRAGGRDPVVKLLQQYWTLPAQDGPATRPAELNK